MKLLVLPVMALFALGACAAPPSSEMERYARLAAGAELASQKCAIYAGGYDNARAMRADANKNIATARELGATDAVIKKARSDANSSFGMQAAFTTPQEACNSLIGNLAWSTD